MEHSETIIGISLGTRTIGLAVFRNGKLVEWKAKAFYERWSTKKLKYILTVLLTYIEKQHATALAIKAPSPERSSMELNQLITAIKKASCKKNFSVSFYCINELKHRFSTKKRCSKTVLVDFGVEKNPALLYEYKKIRENKSAYYTKIFEGIAVADLHNCKSQNLPS